MAFHPNWKSLSTVDFAWKQFVREGTSTDSLSSSKTKYIYNRIGPLHQHAKPLTGDEAKQLYEEVLSRPSASLVHSSPDRPRLDCENHGTPNTDDLEPHRNTLIPLFPRPSSTSTLPPPTLLNKTEDISTKDNFTTIINSGISSSCTVTSFMKEAQENNVKSVSKLLAERVDINITDQYGWTALMCAACSGAKNVVELLINSGADVNIKDKSGRNCLSLARRQGHASTVQVIEKSLVSKHTDEQFVVLGEQAKCSEKNFYCNICRRSFCETSQEKHLTSTVHLFNSRPKSLGTIYGIPESNKGYQILLKGGWDREQGLGPEGSGHKFPCKTVLKRDRMGLGKPHDKPRVTHFEPKEEAAVSFKRKKMSRRQKHNESSTKDKRRDRELRRELS